MKRLLLPGLLAAAGLVCVLSALETEGVAECVPGPEDIPSACYPGYETSPTGSPSGSCMDDGTGACFDEGCEGATEQWGHLIMPHCGIGYIREASVDRCQSDHHQEFVTLHSWVSTCQIFNGNCTCFWVQSASETEVLVCSCIDLAPLTY